MPKKNLERPQQVFFRRGLKRDFKKYPGGCDLCEGHVEDFIQGQVIQLCEFHAKANDHLKDVLEESNG